VRCKGEYPVAQRKAKIKLTKKELREIGTRAFKRQPTPSDLNFATTVVRHLMDACAHSSLSDPQLREYVRGRFMDGIATKKRRRQHLGGNGNNDAEDEDEEDENEEVELDASADEAMEE